MANNQGRSSTNTQSYPAAGVIADEKWVYKIDKNNKKIYNSEMITTKAEKIADILSDGRSKENKNLSITQVRKFYNEFKKHEISLTKDNFEENKALIYMLKSKAAYSSEKIGENFKQFIFNAINSINSYENFKDFMMFFEAVYGFLKNKPGIKK